MGMMGAAGAQQQQQRTSFSGGGSGANAHGSSPLFDMLPEDHSPLPGPPRPPVGGQRTSHAAPSSMGTTAGKRRQSNFRAGMDATAGPSGAAELPSIDSARDGKSTSRPPSNTVSNTGRRVVGFSES